MGFFPTSIERLFQHSRVRLEGCLNNPNYDYVPLLSTAVGLINLFYKCVILPHKDKPAITNNRYYTYLQQKSFLRCIVALFPVIGNIAIGGWDLFHNKPTTQTKAIPSTQSSPSSLTLTPDYSSSQREAQAAPSAPDPSRQNHPRATTDQPVFAPLIPPSSRKELRIAFWYSASGVDHSAENANGYCLASTKIMTSTLPTNSSDSDTIGDRFTIKPHASQSNSALTPSTTILAKDLQKEAETNYDKLPQEVLAHCIEFVGNALVTSCVSKHFLCSSYDACESIAKANKEIFSRAIITKAPNSNPEWGDSTVHEYWNPIKTIYSTCIDQVRALGIKVDRPQELPLQTLIQQIRARDFNLFFTAMLKQFRKQTLPLTSEERDQVIAQQKLWSAERDDLEKAKQGRTWMQENQAILQKFRSLNLGGLGLSYLPPEIGLLTGLESLDLSRNRLKSLSRRIGCLIKLKLLFLWENQLKSLPREISKLTKLNWLGLHSNQLKSVPEEIGFLIALKYLNLSQNRLKSLPRQISKLTALEQLYLQNNPFNFSTQEVHQRGVAVIN